MKKIYSLAFTAGLSLLTVAVKAQGQSPQFFKMGGNTLSGTPNTSEKLGFTTSADLRLITGDMTRMFISKDGNVGIGTENPSERLQIEGSLKATGCIRANCLDVKSATFSDSIKIGSNSIWIGGNNQNTGANNRIYSDNGSSLYIQSQAGNGNTIINAINLGKVGIGTADPKEKLHVKGITCEGCPVGPPENDFPKLTTYISIEDELRTAADAFIRSEHWKVGVSGNSGSFLIKNVNQLPMLTITKDYKLGIGPKTLPSATLDIYSFSTTNDMLSIANSVSTKLVVKNSGNVGIGTQTPQAVLDVKGNTLISGNVGIGTTNTGSYQLAVEGKAGAREFRVTQAAWADYVFDSEYKLSTLYEVEKYINKNKHLPGMPSAKEIDRDGGFDLGATQVKLLEKIEELYLHSIEMNKKIEALERENQSLKKQIR